MIHIILIFMSCSVVMFIHSFAHIFSSSCHLSVYVEISLTLSQGIDKDKNWADEPVFKP